MPKTFCKDCGGIEIDEQEVCHCAESSIPSSLLLDLLTRLVDQGCNVASEIDGDIHCHFCYACLSVNEAHGNDCPYTEAQAVLSKSNAELSFKKGAKRNEL